MNTNTFPNQTSKYILSTHYAQSIFLQNATGRAFVASQVSATMACRSDPTYSLVLYSLGAENGFYL